MDFVTILMLLHTKSYVMSLNFRNSLFLRLKSLSTGLSWDLRTWNKWSNTCGFSGCSEQQLSVVSISLSPAKKRCEGWQPGFSWDQCWVDCLNNDYLNVYWTLDELLCIHPWMHIRISHVLELKFFPFLFLTSLSGMWSECFIWWQRYLKLFPVESLSSHHSLSQLLVQPTCHSLSSTWLYSYIYLWVRSAEKILK